MVSSTQQAYYIRYVLNATNDKKNARIVLKIGLKILYEWFQLIIIK
jgi:hypothetical protein